MPVLMNDYERLDRDIEILFEKVDQLEYLEEEVSDLRILIETLIEKKNDE